MREVPNHGPPREIWRMGPGASPVTLREAGMRTCMALVLRMMVSASRVSVTGGWVGSARFDKFLSPVFQSDGAAYGTLEASAATLPAQEHTDEGRSELFFTSISVGAAILGLYLAWLLYMRRPQLPQQIAQGLGGFYQAVFHKYYVDELYAILFVKPLLDGSTRILWHGVDQNVIDAALDNSADGTREVSDSLRHMQSGNLRSYAGWIAVGAAAIIAYMIWMGTR